VTYLYNIISFALIFIPPEFDDLRYTNKIISHCNIYLSTLAARDLTIKPCTQEVTYKGRYPHIYVVTHNHNKVSTVRRSAVVSSTTNPGAKCYGTQRFPPLSSEMTLCR